MNFSKLKTELLRAMRGRLSQMQISRRMGFQYNCISRWETGQTSMSWLEFAEFSRACKIELAVTMRNEVGFHGDILNYSSLITHLSGSRSVSAIAAITGKSIDVVGNWLKRRTCPTVESIFALIYEQQFVLTEFISKLVPLEKVPSIRSIAETIRVRREFAYRRPEIGAVIACLKLKEYRALRKHKTGWVAQKIGIPQAKENALLAELVDCGILKLSLGKYVPTGNSSTAVDTHGDISGVVAIRKYWSTRFLQMLERMKSVPQETKSGYFVFEASEETEKAIYDEYFQFMLKIRALISKESSSNKTVKVLNLEIIDVPEMTEICRRAE